MRTFLARSLLFLAFFGGVSFLLSQLYARIVMADSFLVRRDRQYRELERQLDFLFVGDSHVRRGVDPAVIPRSFNFGSASESAIQSYYKLRTILAGPGPARGCRVVAMPLDLHTFSSYRTNVIRHEFYWKRYVDFLELGRRKGEVVRHAAKLVRSHVASYWQEGEHVLAWADRKFGGGEGPGELRLGFVPTKSRFSEYEDREGLARARAAMHLEGHRAFDADLVHYFRRAVELCRSHGKTVVLVRYPVTREYLAAAALRRPDDLPDEVRAVIEENGCVVLDHREDFAGRNYLFSDADHLNAEGARLFGERLRTKLEAVLRR